MAVERNVFLGSRGKGQTREELGPRVAALAARQYGVVARRQLLRLGLSSQQIERLIRAGALHPIHRGVYAVGHPRLTREGRWMAAVLAGGPTAVLSHQSAGIHWAVLRPSPLMPQITTATRGRARPGISVHYSQLRRDEVTAHNGIPVTTVARTLLDLAAVLDRHRLERALAEAEHRRYADSPSLAELIERHRGRRGLATLRAVLSSGHARRGRTRSPLEDRFLRFVDGHGLERPDLNAPLSLGEGFVEVDCLWRPQRVALELDGRDSHLRRRRWEADRRRDRQLLAAGWKPVRVTSEQLDGDRDGLEADLRALGIGAREPAVRHLRDIGHAGAAAVGEE